MKYQNIREEELKNKVAQEYFWPYDCSRIIGNVDFCVAVHQSTKDNTEQESLLWAEAKKGSSDVYKSLVQLILTIGKARTFDQFLPPSFLAAFDGEKIAFVAYNDIHDVFYLNDFNWNVTPSQHQSKEFKLLYAKVKSCIEAKTLLFYFIDDHAQLHKFIEDNFIIGKFGLTKTKIDKNNFMVIYSKWLQAVKPSIAVNWDIAKKSGIIDGDFYLADLLSEDDYSLKDKLFFLLKKDHYELDRQLDDAGFFSSKRTEFSDQQIAHRQFWNKYERPPKKEYWSYMVERRDLLVPQDVRERKGSYFTPQRWVELSQQYLAAFLGEDWQEEYYIWDCAAGTGNLLNGLANKYHIWASTLDKQDVEVMKDRIKNGANLLEDHVFQFDFLNDEFDKLPKGLQSILNDPNKRKKLLIYINPPYAEASDKKTLTKGKTGKAGVEQSATNKKYAHLLRQGNAELFVQFLIRIYKEIPDCLLAQFSTLKILQGQHFEDFRNHFLARLERLFIMPANTFDNVNGQFPIGFFIWDTNKHEKFDQILADVYDHQGNFLQQKNIQNHTIGQYINDWVKPYRADVSKNQLIGKFPFKGNDFQNQNMIQIVHHNMDYNTEAGQFYINQKNLGIAAVYFAVRKCIPATWLNDRDQFLFPNDNWKNDTEFQNDCLAYTLFSHNIQSEFGTNHWIPFTEEEVNARTKFESNFMAKYIQGKVDTSVSYNLFERVEKTREKPLVFSAQALAVFKAGQALWQYYQEQPSVNVNASLYDIKLYFQGRNDKGKMNNQSSDLRYMALIKVLKDTLEQLAKKIQPKIYEHGFLLR